MEETRFYLSGCGLTQMSADNLPLFAAGYPLDRAGFHLLNFPCRETTFQSGKSVYQEAHWTMVALAGPGHDNSSIRIGANGCSRRFHERASISNRTSHQRRAASGTHGISRQTYLRL
jgi:hypothetical protein